MKKVKEKRRKITLKNMNLKEGGGGGNDQNAQYISLLIPEQYIMHEKHAYLYNWYASIIILFQFEVITMSTMGDKVSMK